MKKLIAILLVAVMAMGLAACGAAEETKDGTTTAGTTTTPQLEAPASALEVLEKVWALYAEDQKFFAMGGDYNAPVDNAPGAVTAQDHMTASLIVPESELANITDAAALMHAMNANTFTCGAYKVADAAAFAAAMQTAIQGNQWMCGFPETLLIANVGGVVVVAFGNGELVSYFQTNLSAAYAGAEILVNEAISE